MSHKCAVCKAHATVQCNACKTHTYCELHRKEGIEHTRKCTVHADSVLPVGPRVPRDSRDSREYSYDLYEVMVDGEWIPMFTSQKNAVQAYLDDHGYEWYHDVAGARPGDTTESGGFVVGKFTIKGQGPTRPWRVGRQSVSWISAKEH